MQAFFAAFKQFFNMFTTLFAAGEMAAKTVHNVVEIGHNMSSVALLKNQITDQAEIDDLRTQLAARKAANATLIPASQP